MARLLGALAGAWAHPRRRLLSGPGASVHVALRQRQEHRRQVAVRIDCHVARPITLRCLPVRRWRRSFSIRFFLPPVRWQSVFPLAISWLGCWNGRRFAAARWIASAILVPMTIPSLLSAIAWIQLLDPRIGLVNVVLRSMLGLSDDTGPFDIYTLYGMCFVQGLRLVPSAYLMIAASFRAMDPSLEEQSAMAGRGVAQTTLSITLPIMRPALLAAFIYFIIVVIESFDIPGSARFHRAHSRAQHGDLLGDPLGSGIAGLRFGVGFGNDHSGCGAAADVALSAADQASGALRDHHRQRLSAAASQLGRVDRFRRRLFAWATSVDRRAVAVRDVALDQRAAVLCGSVGGLARADDLRGLFQYLAGRQRHARAVEHYGAGADHLGSNDSCSPFW